MERYPFLLVCPLLPFLPLTQASFYPFFADPYLEGDAKSSQYATCPGVVTFLEAETI
jgi:hypothetical protein